MVQRLPTVAQVKAVKTSENLVNEIRQVIYPLHQAKETTKKVHYSIMNLINTRILHL